MTNTTNYLLNLIEEHDLMDYAPFNENAQIIDAEMKRLSDAVAPIPTMETAISNNATAITGLTTRVGEAETAISANATAITAVQSENSAQWSQISTNHSDIVSLSSRATALETKEGSILRNNNGSYSLDPTIIKKLTFIGDVSFDQTGHINLIIPANYLPISFSNYFVNASIYCKQTEGVYLPYTFTRAYLSTNGNLVIAFGEIDPVGNVLPDPVTDNVVGCAEIIFI